jgi:threonine/homoserine/homoserine lactone efflux protein
MIIAYTGVEQLLVRRSVAPNSLASVHANTRQGSYADHHEICSMYLLPFLKAIGIGVAVAAPVGPMSVLCMRRTLTKGWQRGFSTGLGIATGDGAYAFVAALGLAGVSRFMLLYDKPLHFAAGLFLLYLGLRMFLNRSDQPSQPDRAVGWFKPAYVSALFLTLTNPPTIVSFAAIFTVLAPPAGFDLQTALLTVAGVFLGSSLWWLLLTLAISLVRHIIGPRTRHWINGISSAVLGFFGIAEIRRAV